MVIYLSLLVALLGVLAYALSANAKVQEIGRIAYFSGLLAFLIRPGRTAASRWRVNRVLSFGSFVVQCANEPCATTGPDCSMEGLGVASDAARRFLLHSSSPSASPSQD